MRTRTLALSLLMFATVASKALAQPGHGPLAGGGSGGGVTGLTSCADGTALADNALMRADGTTKCQGSTVTVADSTGDLQWEGTTADDFEGNFTFADPTADWTWGWTATGQAIVPVGTALLPTYSFTGDPNTGIYGDGSDSVRFSTGGSQRLTIDNGLITASLNTFGNAFLLYGFTVSISNSTAGSGAPSTPTFATNMFIYTNSGTTVANYHTLPTATTGYNYRFCVQDADGMRITANTSDTIRVIDKVTAAAGYIESTTIGSCVELVAINAVEWFAVSIHGTWTDGTFTYDDTGLTTP